MPRPSGPGPRNEPAQLAQANARRTSQAGQRDAARAAAILARLGDECPPAYREVAEARIAAPGLSWAEIGAKLGISKDAAAGRFRRLSQLTGPPPGRGRPRLPLSDAENTRDCPWCGAQAGRRCVNPNGTRYQTGDGVHVARRGATAGIVNRRRREPAETSGND